MLQFWCLSPVRVAYHGPFRENLGSAFWGFGLSYHNLIRQMQVFKTEHLKCCSFDASPQSEWFITAHLERIWNHHFGALDCHMSYHNLMKHMQVFKTEHLKSCSFDASPQSEWLITAHLQRIWGQHFGALDCLSYHNLIRQVRVFKTEHFKMLEFWCLSPVIVVYHGSFRENMGSAFWGFGLSYHNLIRQMQVFKTEHLKCCSFDASPLSEWLITAHLERIWSQHFGALGCHIVAWLGRCKSSKKAPLECCSFDAFLMPLPSQSVLSRLI